VLLPQGRVVRLSHRHRHSSPVVDGDGVGCAREPLGGGGAHRVGVVVEPGGASARVHGSASMRPARRPMRSDHRSRRTASRFWMPSASCWSRTFRDSRAALGLRARDAVQDMLGRGYQSGLVTPVAARSAPASPSLTGPHLHRATEPATTCCATTPASPNPASHRVVTTALVWEKVVEHQAECKSMGTRAARRQPSRAEQLNRCATCFTTLARLCC